MKNKRIKVYSSFELLHQDESSVSFLNLYSLYVLLNTKLDTSNINYYVDGSISALVFQILYRKKINRYSFDFTSIAHKIFAMCEKYSLNLYVVGSKQNELELFVCILKDLYTDLNIVGTSDGYFSDESNLLNEINNSGASIVLIGLGTPKQDEFSIALKRSGYKGASYTCGGFIHQTASSSGVYYPHLINKLNLRFLYRIYKEPYTIKRYFFYYPLCIIRLFFLSFSKSNKIVIK